MDDTQVLEFYKELYFFQHARRDNLDARLTLPVGVITLLAGAVLFFLKQDASTKVLAAHAILVTSLAATGALMMACVYFVRALYNHTYHHMPTLRALETHRKVLADNAAELRRYYAQYPRAAAAAMPGVPNPEGRFRTSVIEELAKGGHYNAVTNNRRSGLLHRGHSFLVAALVLLLASALAYVASI